MTAAIIILYAATVLSTIVILWPMFFRRDAEDLAKHLNEK